MDEIDELTPEETALLAEPDDHEPHPGPRSVGLLLLAAQEALTLAVRSEDWSMYDYAVGQNLFRLLSLKVVDADDEYLKPEEVADWLKVRKDWVYDLVQRGQMPHHRIGRLLRFQKAELRQWIKKIQEEQ